MSMKSNLTPPLPLLCPRWAFFRQAHALTRLRHHVGPVPADVRETHGRPSLHTCSDGRDLLVSCHSLCPR